MFWFIISLAIIGFGALIENLILALVSYSLFLTIDFYIGVLYLGWNIVFIIMGGVRVVSGAEYHSAHAAIAFVSNYLCGFLMVYYITESLI